MNWRLKFLRYLAANKLRIERYRGWCHLINRHPKRYKIELSMSKRDMYLMYEGKPIDEMEVHGYHSFFRSQQLTDLYIQEANER